MPRPADLMDVTALAGLSVGIAGIIGAIVAWRRFPADRESLAVKTQRDVMADMRDLVDELVEALERCRARRIELEAERDELQRREEQLRTRLRDLGYTP